MHTANLCGPFELTADSIEQNLGGIISAGVVVFGKYGIRHTWEVQKVDRSDVHLRARLWANMADFRFFSYQLCSSSQEAYVLHCELFHYYKPKNGIHPVRPENSNLECPVCTAQPAGKHEENVA